MCHPSFTADVLKRPTLITVKDLPALGVLCKTHHTSTHQLLRQWKLLICLSTFSFLLTIQIQCYLFSRHIPEMLEDDKCTNIAYKNSSADTANTFIKSARHYSNDNCGYNWFPGSKGGNNYVYFVPPIVLPPWLGCQPSPTWLREHRRFLAPKTQLWVSAVTEIMHRLCLSPFCSCFHDWSLVVTHTSASLTVNSEDEHPSPFCCHPVVRSGLGTTPLQFISGGSDQFVEVCEGALLGWAGCSFWIQYPQHGSLQT